MHANRLIITAVAVVLLTACTAGQTTAPTITTTNPLDPSYSHLQFAVGTANLYGTGTGLNVVSTLRQPNGQSAVGVDTPVIYGPFAFTLGAVPAAGGSFADPYTTIVNIGPSLQETLVKPISIRSTPQFVAAGTPFCDGPGAVPAGFVTCPAGITPNTTTFGQSGGVFAMGIAPYNTVANTGQSYSYAPYPEPIFSSSHALFFPWGGPPAFDPDGNGLGTRDGLIILGTDSFGEPYFLGVGEGISVFDGVTPAAGLYALQVQISYLGNNAQPITGTIGQTARLSTLALLPPVSAPLVTPDASGDGGATFSFTLPAGVTQAFVQIVDYGPGGSPGTNVANCQGPKGTNFAPVYYTVLVTKSGGFSLGPNHGPNPVENGTSVQASPSICTAAQNNTASYNGYTPVDVGDSFTVQVLGFDYPIYGAVQSLIQGGVQAPPLVGPAGQDDITVSVPELEAPPYTSATPLWVTRRPLFHRFAPRRIFVQGSPDSFRRLGVPPPR